MPAGTLSYSQSLRVIGQNLTPLGASQFELATSSDGYVVRLPKPEAPPAGNSSFFDKLVERLKPPAKTLESISFSSMDLLRSDIEQQAKRKTDSPRDNRDLSFALRIVGHYLDRRLARDFTVSVNPELIQVNYDQKQEGFTPQHIYDLGIQMYLKRANRP